MASAVGRTYDQYCPIAHALGAVGERWSLLIVRELLHGQRRYTDLADALPGIGTNILAARLRELEAAGVVAKRRLLPPTPATVYELTEKGRGLHPVLHELARWGARSSARPPRRRPRRTRAGSSTHCASRSRSPRRRAATSSVSAMSAPRSWTA